jgi:hypothetical protein
MATITVVQDDIKVGVLKCISMARRGLHLPYLVLEDGGDLIAAEVGHGWGEGISMGRGAHGSGHG